MRRNRAISNVQANRTNVTDTLEQKMLDRISEKLDGDLKPYELLQLSQALFNLRTAERDGRFIPYDPNAFHI